MTDLAPLSALNQLSYCPHRAFLMHRCMEMRANEHVWRGRWLHRRVDRGQPERRGEIQIQRGRRVASSVLGITGVIDQLEHHPHGVQIVEFKRGRAPSEGAWPNDALQLAAQALCLEEEGVQVLEGVVYYERSGARRTLILTDDLKEQVRACCARLHEILRGVERTAPTLGPKCRGCSMFDVCLPQGTDDAHLWAEGDGS